MGGARSGASEADLAFVQSALEARGGAVIPDNFVHTAKGYNPKDPAMQLVRAPPRACFASCAWDAPAVQQRREENFMTETHRLVRGKATYWRGAGQASASACFDHAALTGGHKGRTLLRMPFRP